MGLWKFLVFKKNYLSERMYSKLHLKSFDYQYSTNSNTGQWTNPMGHKN